MSIDLKKYMAFENFATPTNHPFDKRTGGAIRDTRNADDTTLTGASMMPSACCTANAADSTLLLASPLLSRARTRTLATDVSGIGGTVAVIGLPDFPVANVSHCALVAS
ncbi:hypothetical protein P9302_03155 [Brevibacillus agri]|uniref:hypothetical protein n=1 Tax=Brevibacillus agri TaxID=51101 RepID=UPI002E231FD1|nr:hypothetical protein [Brevibacillus agri]